MPFDVKMIDSIINEALLNGSEAPWIEFKTNYYDPQAIGEYISALSNTAALFNQPHGFLIWGVDDTTHEIVGTTFDPQAAKKGNQNLSLYLATQLEPQVQFYFHSTQINHKNVVLLEVMAAYASPVKFRGVDYIRIDSCKKKLADFSDTERELWAVLSHRPFESLIALDNVPGEYVLRVLDYPAYFDMLSLELPRDPSRILECLLNDWMLEKDEAGSYNITNLGAILFAKRLKDFPSLERKAIRVIKYNGNSRTAGASKEQIGAKGYANGFDGLISYIANLLPENEIMGQALRRVVPMYPELAIRELVANALIHQNFFLQGVSPIIEIFDNRLEITNPGTPLIEKERFVDHPPVSRNERLAAFMRRVGVCEERGSGYDKVVAQTELFQLPAPDIEVFSNQTRIVLCSYQPYAQMSREDRQRACYLHACLKRVNREYMTNSTLRERFAISAQNSSMISRLLSETCESGLIKVSPDSTSDKNRRYLPFWA